MAEGGGAEDYRVSRTGALKRAGARETIGDLGLSYSRYTPETQITYLSVWETETNLIDELKTEVSDMNQ